MTACGSSSGPATSTDCSALHACCASSSFPSNEVAACNVIVQGGVDSVCVTSLADYTQAGSCGGTGKDGGTGTGCASKAQSVTYTATGTCGGGSGGTVTVGVDAGSCNLELTGDPAVGLPSRGTFTPTASHTSFDITKGNWGLAVDLGNAQSGSSDVQCTITSISAKGQVDLSCVATTCPPGGGSCSTNTCVARLIPM
jgi:hypothetical protein